MNTSQHDDIIQGMEDTIGSDLTGARVCPHDGSVLPQIVVNAFEV